MSISLMLVTCWRRVHALTWKSECNVTEKKNITFYFLLHLLLFASCWSSLDRRC